MLNMHRLSVVIKFYLRRIQHITDKYFIFILSLIIGILAGLSALLLRTGVFWLRNILVQNPEFGISNLLFFVYPAIGIFIVVIINKYILKDKTGHSISSILYSISKQKSYLPPHKMFSSITGGLLTAGLGGSVGLESPIISSGASIGSNIARYFRMDYKTTTVLLACGAAGAISGIFNTPIAGVIFALEVLMLDLTRFSLIPLLISSTSGAVISQLFYKQDILFEFTINQSFEPSQIHLYVLLGALAGLYSRYFAKFYNRIHHFFFQFKKYRYRVLLGALISGVLLFLFPALFGEGFTTVKTVLNGGYLSLMDNSVFSSFKENPWLVVVFMLLLIFAKAVATSANIAAGGVGGVFAPALFAGALVGFLYAHTLNLIFPEMVLSEQNFALVGMAAVLAGVIHAPLTGLFLIAEVTSGYQLIIPLMAATTVSFVTVKVFTNNSIFTKELEEHGELITHNKDKAVLRFMFLDQVIEHDFLVVSPDQSLGELTKVISKSHRDIFPVLDDENNFLGIITMDDLREIMFDRSMYDVLYAHNIMSVPKAVIHYQDSPEEAVKKFKDSGRWNLPVIKDGKYLGFISKSGLFDVYRNLLKNISDD
jgi:CIC family chloride channel protein